MIARPLVISAATRRGSVSDLGKANLEDSADFEPPRNKSVSHFVELNTDERHCIMRRREG
jgi:hypothetical protein